MVGKTVSHYKILERIGGGGMGVVYKAEDTKLDRPVALKFLPQHLTTDKELKNRFIHEAKAASALQHNNICTIHDIDETEDGQSFIVMDCYEGETLKKKIEQKPLDIDDALDITIQVAQGLEKAHKKDIIHRDIKPANIIITEDGVAKIVDFGLAKLSKYTRLTKEGASVGTIAYMSPEQTKGEEVDSRSDIWSLGVVLYEMISGQLPFRGDYDQAFVYSILNEEPETPDRDTPDKLMTIVYKCLEKNPSDRYQEIGELINEMDGLRSGKVVSQTRSIVHKKKYISFYIPAAAILVIILVVFGYLYIPFGVSDKTEVTSTDWENSIAVLPFVDFSPSKDQEYFCDGMTEQIRTNLSKIKRLKVIARTSVMTYKNTDKKIPQIGKELNVSHILEGSIRKYENSIRVTAQLINTEDGSHLWADDFDRELEHVFEVQDDVSQMIASNLLSTLSIQEIEEIKTDRPNNIENYDQYMRADNFHTKFLQTQNPDYLHDAILLFKDILKKEPDYLAANVELADVYNSYFNMVAKTDEEKSRYLQLQKKYIDIAYSLNPKSSDVLLVKMVVSHAEQGIEYYDEIRFKSFMEYLKIDPNRVSVNLMVGIWLRDYGLVHQSLIYFNDAVELDPLYTWNCSNRGWAYFLIGEYEKAELDFKKALKIEPYDLYNIRAYTQYLIMFERIKEAEKLISKWKDIKPSDNNLELHRALLYAVKGDKENALSSFIKTAFDKKYNASFALARLYLLLNDQEKAIELIIEGEKDYSSRGISRSRYFGYLNLPYYKILHNDPRFQEILVKHKELYEENLRKYGDIDL
jgi:serine/threonine protein kinase